MTAAARSFHPIVPTSRRQLCAIVGCLVAGTVLRLLWPADMEWKLDEQWMATHALAIANGAPLPWVGMTSGAGGPNHPALGVWLFALFGRITPSPLGLVEWVRWLNVAALWGWAAFAWRCVPDERRGTWLWGIALFAVAPLPVLFARKIWIPDLLPLLGMPLLWAHHYRRKLAGAFAWGALGALLGQVHLSGFFFAFALFLVTVLRRSAREGMSRAAWSAWGAGSVLAALPLIPWMRSLGAGGHAAKVGVRQMLSGRFFAEWVLNAWGLHLSYSARAFFTTFLTYPLLAGHPTYLMAIAHAALAITGAYATARWAYRRFWLSDRIRDHDPVLSMYLAVGGVVTGLLLTLVAVKVRAHYLVVVSPFIHLWAAALLRDRVRLLATVVALQLAISITYLATIHARGGIPEGDYGMSYRVSAERLLPAGPRDPRFVVRPR